MAAGTLASLWSKKLKGKPEEQDTDDGSPIGILKEAQNVRKGPVGKRREEKSGQPPQSAMQSEHQVWTDY